MADGVGERHPGAALLRDWKARAYLGAAVRDAEGVVVGHIFACDDRCERGAPDLDLVKFIAEWLSGPLADCVAEDSGRTDGRTLAAILDALPAVVHLKDREGRYSFVNKALRDRSGGAAGARPGAKRGRADRARPDGRSTRGGRAFRCSGRQCLAQRRGPPLQRYSYEIRSGSEVHWLVVKRPVVVGRDRAPQLVTLAVNMRDEDRAERALQKREVQLKALLDNLPGIAFRARIGRGGERKLLFLSGGLRSAYGWTQMDHQYDAQRLSNLVFGPEDRERYQRESITAFGAGQSYHGVFEINTRTEDRKWAMIRSRVTEEDDDGWLVDSLAIDVTDQIRAEQALREREAQLAVVLANLPGAAWRIRVLHDNRREFLFVSDGIQGLTGWRADELCPGGEERFYGMFDADTMTSSRSRLHPSGCARRSAGRLRAAGRIASPRGARPTVSSSSRRANARSCGSSSRAFRTRWSLVGSESAPARPKSIAPISCASSGRRASPT